MGMIRGTCARAIVRALMVMLVLGAVSAPLADARQSATVTDQWSAVLSSQRDLLQQQIADEPLSTYTIDAELIPATTTDYGLVEGTMSLEWVNPAQEAADKIYLRLYANDERYRDGSTDISDVTVDGKAVKPKLSVTDTLVTLPLTSEVAPGDTAEIELSFVSTVPNNVVSSYGMFNHDTESDSYTLDHWFPLLAGYDPANGYVLDPLSINGDPVFSNVAYFNVTLTTPEAMVVASTGTIDEKKTAKGATTTSYISGPVRDFTLAASEHFEVATGMAGDTEVRSYYLPGHEARGEASVKWATDTIDLFNALVGVYPYAQLSIVDAVIGGGAAGIEFPQIVYIASDYYDESLQEERLPHGQEFTVVHEVLHQWWYGVIGNNHYQHAFLDESLTNYLTVVYFEKVYGEDVAQQQALLNIVAPYLIYLYGIFGDEHDDEILNTPTDSFSTEEAYGTIIYCKGGVAMQAIREAIGDDAFFGALRSYFAEQSLRIAQPDDLLNAFVDASSTDVKATWDNWIESANGKEDIPRDVAEQLLGGLAG